MEYLILNNSINIFDISVQYTPDVPIHKTDTGGHHVNPLYRSKFKAIALIAGLFLEPCLKSSLLVFVTGLAEKSEHVLLVSLNTGLVKRINGKEIT